MINHDDNLESTIIKTLALAYFVRMIVEVIYNNTDK